MQRFSEKRWDAARLRAVARAFREVPYYREQWAVAGRALSEPVPVASDGLADQAFRLCPMSKPWLPDREPSLWTGDPGALREALRLAGVASHGVPVIEVRPATVDWRSLGRGLRYAALLPPGADTIDDERRRLLNAPALALAARAGRAVLVGTPAEIAAVRPELEAEVTTVRRGTVTEVAAGAGLAHDPCLGYLGATVPSCGRLHLMWRRHHARAGDGALLVTALRRRPVLCSVVPAGSGGAFVGQCPEHHSPILLTGEDRSSGSRETGHRRAALSGAGGTPPAPPGGPPAPTSFA